MVRIERDVREFWAGRALNKVAGKPGGRGARHGDGRAATAQKLLEMRMVAAVSEAAENAGRASQPEFAFRTCSKAWNGPRRYALAKEMPDVVGKCDRVLAFLANGNARVEFAVSADSLRSAALATERQPGGLWRFVMHGPHGADYENESVFVEIVKP